MSSLACVGNDKTMNINPLILTNIQSSLYFKNTLVEITSYGDIIDEIYNRVSHLEPWEKGTRHQGGQTGMCGGVRGVGSGGIISSSFCLLYKLHTMRLGGRQLHGLITHRDSPYIRAMGFMYLRFTQLKTLWGWFEPFLNDHQPIDVKAGGGHVISIGEMLRLWLTKLDWFETIFPRIPVPVHKEIDAKLRELGPYKSPVEEKGRERSYSPSPSPPPRRRRHHRRETSYERRLRKEHERMRRRRR
ncbi:pre-mRNA-splicing factor 38B-like [Octopus sinensis]|uniref:Pre-mRNA-splicing factor 38 n=1 Tax=Octopus sinensis TaxID=2607531 RepID=A0A6P7TY38_9MOLL|nr:pre-mRNA-splicing factor 38B-like [Octopus sinensis]